MPKNKIIKVSIIVPVYNTAPYLERCLDSLVNQTLKDIEIICIDDGSTDSSSSILAEYERRDKRIRLIIFEANQGVSMARNAGLAVARGGYIGFVDSDDHVEPHFYERLHAAALGSGADIAKGCRLDEGDREPFRQFQDNERISREKYYFWGHFTTAIYRAAIIHENSIVFPQGITNFEDIFFLLQSIHYANKVATINDSWYYRTIRIGSASQRENKLQMLQESVDASYKILDFINSVHIERSGYDQIFKRIITRILSREAPEGRSELLVEWTVRLLQKYAYAHVHNSVSSAFTPFIEEAGAARVYQRTRSVYRNTPPVQREEARFTEQLVKIGRTVSICLYLGESLPLAMELRALSLAQSLSRSGMDVHFMCNILDSRYAYYCESLGHTNVTVHILGKKTFSAGAAFMKKHPARAHCVGVSPLHRVLYLSPLGKLTDTVPAMDILHCFGDDANCAGGYAGLLAGIPGILLSGFGAGAKRLPVGDTSSVYRFLHSHPNVGLETSMPYAAKGAAEGSNPITAQTHAGPERDIFFDSIIMQYASLLKRTPTARPSAEKLISLPPKSSAAPAMAQSAKLPLTPRYPDAAKTNEAQNG